MIIRDAFHLVGGGTPSTTESKYWGSGVPWISSSDIDDYHNISIRRFVTDSGIVESATNRVSKGSVIVVTRVGLGKVALLPQDMCFSQDIQALIPKANISANNKFMLFQLEHVMGSLKYASQGTTISGITKKQLSDASLFLPSLPEQERIVARIEELFSDLDKGVEALQTIKAQLKVYRQAVLKEAFEGSLTGSHPQAKQELGDFIEVPRYGTAKKCSFDNVENSTPVYRIPNIHPVLGVISHSDIKSACFSESELAPIRLRIGDILIIRSNGSPSLVGRAAIIRESDTDAVFAGYLLRLRISKLEKLDSLYLLNYLASHEARIYIERTARSTSGVNNISAGEICQLKVPIFSLQEQKLIVTEIESRLSVCDKIEQTVDESLGKAESLRQSILKKAFEGRLI